MPEDPYFTGTQELPQQYLQSAKVLGQPFVVEEEVVVHVLVELEDLETIFLEHEIALPPSYVGDWYV
jgi:hypothetical protein